MEKPMERKQENKIKKKKKSVTLSMILGFKFHPLPTTGGFQI